MHPILGVTKDDNKKEPAMYKLYDFTKGETDIVDQKLGNILKKRKVENGQGRIVLSYLLDTNASKLVVSNTIKDPKTAKFYQFGTDLVTRLVMPQIERRNISGVSSAVLNKMSGLTRKVTIQPMSQF